METKIKLMAITQELDLWKYLQKIRTKVVSEKDIVCWHNQRQRKFSK